MAARVFAVLAAVFLVLAVGLAALTPTGMKLAEGLLMLDHSAVDWLRANCPPWLWFWVVLPFLLRPLWMLPACVGVVCAGLAGSFNLGKTSTTRRRRS